MHSSKGASDDWGPYNLLALFKGLTPNSRAPAGKGRGKRKVPRDQRVGAANTSCQSREFSLSPVHVEHLSRDQLFRFLPFPRPKTMKKQRFLNVKDLAASVPKDPKTLF